MKTILQMKWLALAVCLCVPTATWAEEDGTEYVNLTTLSELSEVTNSCGTISTNGGTITMAFTTDCYDSYSKSKGIGWQSSSPDYLDLSGYSEIIVNYSNFTTNYYESDIQLYVADSNGYGAAVAGSNGTIDFVFSSNASGYGQSWNGMGTIDYTSIESILICVHLSSSASVDITSIQLVKSSSSNEGEGGEGEDGSGEGGTGEGGSGEGGSGEGGENGSGESGSGESGSTDITSPIPATATTLSLSGGDITLTGNDDNVYHITGNGTDVKSTILFPEGASGKTYTIYLDNITINTTDRTAAGEESGTSKRRTSGYSWSITTATTENTGWYIPAGTTADIYLIGENNITGSVYGIYAGTGALLNLYPVGEYLHANGDNTDGLVDIETTQLYITGGEMGIANEGNKLTFYGCEKNAAGDAYNKSSGDYIGITYITAEKCGIYSPNGVDLERTCVDITVNGNGSVTVDSSPTTKPGYTINTLVCGIYVKTSSSTAAQLFTTGVVNLTIVASGTDTYGIFLDGYEEGTTSASAYLGYGTYDITATECVLHHEGEYNSFVTYADATGKCVLILNGPFCKHWYGYGDTYWYCDGTTGTNIFSGTDDQNYNKVFRYSDSGATTSGYSYNVPFTIGEAQYVDRKLYTGWNTVCLPYEYNLDPSIEDDEDSYSGEIEARKIISKYATLDNMTQQGEGETAYYSFTSTAVESGQNQKLEPDRAYMVWVDPDIEDYTPVEGAITVSFTEIAPSSSSLVSVVEVKDDYSGAYNSDSFTEPLLTLYHPETMVKEETDANKKNYLKIDREEDAEGNVINWFNRPASASIILPAYRAYLDANNLQTDSDGNVKLQAVDGFGDETITGIKLVENVCITTPGDIDIYSINGQLLKIVPAGSNVTNGLAKGVYIIDGKKVAVQ